MTSDKWNARTLKLKIPIEYWETCAKRLKGYHTCKVICTVTTLDRSYQIVYVAFRPVADIKFIEVMLTKIDNWANGLVQVINFDRKEVETW